MEDSDLPGIFRAADDLSNKSQRLFFTSLLIHLICLVLAATISILAYSNWITAALQALVMVCALGCSVYLASLRPDKIWYGARALAESLKTISWRFVSKAEPFQFDHGSSVTIFRAKVKMLLDQNRQLAGKLTKNLVEAQLPVSMEEMRSASLEERIKRYQEYRIADQLSWYARKADLNDKLSSTFFALLIASNIVALTLAICRVNFSTTSYWPTDIFLGLAACLLTWMQAKRYSELAASYALAAQEINYLSGQVSRQMNEDDFSSFVGDAENAFSREHTQWIARRDVA